MNQSAYTTTNHRHTSTAQARYNYRVQLGRGDIHGLDGDNDGNACERLP